MAKSRFRHFGWVPVSPDCVADVARYTAVECCLLCGGDGKDADSPPILDWSSTSQEDREDGA